MTEGLHFEHIEVRDVDEALLREVAGLYSTAFGHWPNGAVDCEPWQHLQWKICSPASALGLLIGRRGNRLVQASTVRSLRVRVAGRSRLMIQHPDAAVHPAEQGSGVYRAALEHILGPKRPRWDLNIREKGTHPAMERVDATFGRPIANQVRRLFRVLDARRVLDDQEWIRGGRRRSLARFLLPRLEWLGDRLVSAGRSESPVHEVERFDARVEALFEAVASDFEVIVERNEAFLNWRYCVAAGGPFRVYAWEERGEWLGYCVVRLNPAHWQLADLLVARDRPDVLAGLVREVVTRARIMSGPAAISMWLPRRHPYRSCLRRFGFVDIHSPGGIICEDGEFAGHDLDLLARRDLGLHFTLGDTDLV